MKDLRTPASYKNMDTEINTPKPGFCDHVDSRKKEQPYFRERNTLADHQPYHNKQFQKSNSRSKR